MMRFIQEVVLGGGAHCLIIVFGEQVSARQCERPNVIHAVVDDPYVRDCIQHNFLFASGSLLNLRAFPVDGPSMIDLATLAVFSGAVVLLLLSPGPNMAFVISHGMTHGWRGGAASALGIGVADLLLTALTAMGVTALVASLGRSDSSKTKLLHTVSSTNTPATITVIQVNTSPVLAPKALEPPAPPNAPEKPPPRPF